MVLHFDDNKPAPKKTEQEKPYSQPPHDWLNWKNPKTPQSLGPRDFEPNAQDKALHTTIDQLVQSPDYSPETLNALLTQARAERPHQPINLNHLDLRDKNLAGVDFSHISLKSANLSNTNATGAVFQHADVDAANFHGTNLHGADLTLTRHLPTMRQREGILVSAETKVSEGTADWLAQLKTAAAETGYATWHHGTAEPLPSAVAHKGTSERAVEPVKAAAK